MCESLGQCWVIQLFCLAAQGFRGWWYLHSCCGTVVVKFFLSENMCWPHRFLRSAKIRVKTKLREDRRAGLCGSLCGQTWPSLYSLEDISCFTGNPGWLNFLCSVWSPMQKSNWKVVEELAECWDVSSITLKSYCSSFFREQNGRILLSEKWRLQALRT